MENPKTPSSPATTSSELPMKYKGFSGNLPVTFETER